MYYNHLMIVNDDSSVVGKGSFKTIDNPRVIFFDCHRFIIQATDDTLLAGTYLFPKIVDCVYNFWHPSHHFYFEILT